jgi:hypothetical protein
LAEKKPLGLHAHEELPQKKKKNRTSEKTVRNEITTRLKWQQILKIRNWTRRTDGQTDGMMDRQTDRRNDGQTDGQAAKCTFEGGSVRDHADREDLRNDQFQNA